VLTANYPSAPAFVCFVVKADSGLRVDSGFDESTVANENETSVGNYDGVRIPEILLERRRYLQQRCDVLDLTLETRYEMPIS
jgi:hypothetical protein